MTQTHNLTFTDRTIVKRYTSWSRGEHRREWTVLQQAHRSRPGLVPELLTADLNADPPMITMSRLPGEPLPANPSPAQSCALAAAIQALWSVPVTGVGEWEDDLRFARRLTSGPHPPHGPPSPAAPGARPLPAAAGLAATARPSAGLAAEAYDAATAWWNGPDPALLSTRPARRVLGHRDPNLANYLWDGTEIRIVDFEDAAPSDPATELAIFAEHLSARSLDFDRLITHFPVVDERRFRAARRVFAMLWLSLLLNRQAAEPDPARPPDPPGIVDQQAARLLKLLA